MRTWLAALIVAAAVVVVPACGGGNDGRSPGGDQAFGVYLLGEAGERCDLVVRVVPDGGAPATLREALDLLVAGPDGDEDDEGTSSMFTAATAGMVRTVEVRERVAHVDFEDFSRIIPNASASCGSQALLAQLDATVEQFPGIDRAVYSFVGDRTAFYEWLQLSPPEE